MGPQKSIVEQVLKRICSDSATAHERWKPVYGEGSMRTTMKSKNSSKGNQWSQYVESRYRKVISLPFPSMTAASLHTVGHGCRVPLLEKTMPR